MEMDHFQLTFLAFSKQVCGVDDLSPKLSAVYFNIFNNDNTVNIIFQKLLNNYERIVNRKPNDIVKAILEEILTDPPLKDMVLAIIKLWYLGFTKSLTEAKNTLVPLQSDGFYFHHEALIWKIAHAHPAGLSGGYYGYWAYKPEN